MPSNGLAIMKTTFNNISAYSNANFAFLTKQISQQLDLLEIVRSALPGELAEHAVHCLDRSRKLIIYTDSPAWAAKLRFYEPSVLEKVNAKAKLNLNEFQVKVLSLFSAGAINKRPLFPSQAVTKEIMKVSESLGDRELKQALAKLGKTLSQAKAENKC